MKIFERVGDPRKASENTIHNISALDNRICFLSQKGPINHSSVRKNFCICSPGFIKCDQDEDVRLIHRGVLPIFLYCGTRNAPARLADWIKWDRASAIRLSITDLISKEYELPVIQSQTYSVNNMLDRGAAIASFRCFCDNQARELQNPQQLPTNAGVRGIEV